jgi:hypothetical protein
MAEVFDRLRRRLEDGNGSIWCNSRAVHVERLETGDYRVIVQRGHNRQVVLAAALVIATGGRQASPDVRAALVNDAYTPSLRGNPYSDGSGCDLARSLGATIHDANRGFYGHLFPVGVRATSPYDYVAFAMYHSMYGVIVQADGRRAFPVSHDHLNAIRLAQVANRRALLMWSGRVQDDVARRPAVPGGPALDRFEYARCRGGRVTRADNLANLSGLVKGWGYELDQAPAAYAPEVDPDEPVFAAEVEVAITFTFGGIVSDSEMRVLDALGDVIPNLYVAGADVGDVYHEGYGGGLSLALVTGRRSGLNAAKVSA